MKNIKNNTTNTILSKNKSSLLKSIISIFAFATITLICVPTSNASDLDVKSQYTNENNAIIQQITNTDVLSDVLSSSMEVTNNDVVDISKLLATNVSENTQEQVIDISESFKELNQTNITQISQEAQAEEKAAKIAEEQAPREAESKRQTENQVTDNQKNVAVSEDKKIITIDGQKYRIVEVINNALLTAYDNGIESTGKTPKDKGYAVTNSGSRTHWGTMAIDKNYHDMGDIFYVAEKNAYLNDKPNGRLFVAEDSGSAIKGKKRFDLWFNDHQDALNFGKQNLNVYKLEKIN